MASRQICFSMASREAFLKTIYNFKRCESAHHLLVVLVIFSGLLGFGNSTCKAIFFIQMTLKWNVINAVESRLYVLYTGSVWVFLDVVIHHLVVLLKSVRGTLLWSAESIITVSCGRLHEARKILSAPKHPYNHLEHIV